MKIGKHACSEVSLLNTILRSSVSCICFRQCNVHSKMCFLLLSSNICQVLFSFKKRSIVWFLGLCKAAAQKRASFCFLQS